MSVEHGSMASAETLRLMEEKGTYIIPTQSRGHTAGTDGG